MANSAPGKLPPRIPEEPALDGVSQVVLAAVAAEAAHGVFQVAMAADGRRFPVQEAAAFC